MRATVIAAAAACGLLSMGAAPDRSVGYRVTPVVEGGALRHLQVEMRFRGDADGVTRLELADWGREPNPWSKLGGFDAGTAEVVQDGPLFRVLRHRPGAALVVRYRVLSAHEALPPPEKLETLHRPVILPQFFGAYSDAVFATVEGRDKGPARFSWGPVPAGWRLASDLDHPGPRTVTQTTNSFLMGAPDLRVVERTVLGGPVRVAMHGWFDFADAEFAERIARIAEAQRRFWGDRDAAFFVPMIALPAMGANSGSIGTGRGDAFVMWATANVALDGLTRVLAHEQAHTWIDDEVGGRVEEEEGLEYWFSEGFSDFYAPRSLLGSGLFTLEDHAREVNASLLRYAASPVRTAPNSRIKDEFWKNEDLERLPYDRGHFFATLIDYELRRRSGGRLDLDDVMRAQLAHARRRPASDATSAGRLLPVMVREVGGFDIAELLDRHIQRGEPIVLPADLYGDCARVETVVRPDFHRGFDIEATQKAGGVITGVRANGPAHAAGLRDGMKLVKRELSTVNDPAVEIGYRVTDGGTERLIRYLPAGRERLTVQRVVLAEGLDAARRAACVKSMSGRVGIKERECRPAPRPRGRSFRGGRRWRRRSRSGGLGIGRATPRKELGTMRGGGRRSGPCPPRRPPSG